MGESDHIAWFPTVVGQFILKSAYKLWSNSDYMFGNCLFTHIRNVNAPQRLKAFMWLVMHDALLTNYARLNKGLTTNDLCAICGISSKTMVHALRDCYVAKEL